ncbi:MAG: rhodanese-related sulfurtransferase [Candidatus Pacearchaeota archaeon]
MNKVHILLFYKFVDIKYPETFRKRHLKLLNILGVKGRVLIAKEGINGSISGSREQIEKYKEELKKDKRFEDITFKEEVGLEHPFRRTKVLVRKEIVAIGKKIDLNNKAPYISAEELKQLYGSGADFVILDARNYYEYEVGKFESAIHLNIKTFREFPQAIRKIENLKDKKIITYCTGGIRCEKASAVLKLNGFKEVYQLKDGIINFAQKFPNTYWVGKCFVFDKRLVSDVNNTGETISNCLTCNVSSDLYRNCRNIHCDRLFIQCKKCQESFSGCCSKECLEVFKIQCLVKSIKNQGRKIKENETLE